MKAQINNIEHFQNRSKISLNIVGQHNKLVEAKNKIDLYAAQHKAQTMLFDNINSMVFDNKSDIKGLKNGDIGGTIVFHSHLCNPIEALNGLIEIINSINK